MAGKPVAIIMGSQSDWPTMQHAADTLDELGIGYEARIVSAHRTPERLFQFAKAPRPGLQGGHCRRRRRRPPARHDRRAHPPAGVRGTDESNALSGKDSLLSIVQMPAGIPVGTLAIGKPGASTRPCSPPPSWPSPTTDWRSGSINGAPARPKPSGKAAPK